MTDNKQHHDAHSSGMNSHVEGLLEAIHARTSGEIQEYMEQDPPPRLESEGRFQQSYAELAEAFEMDICDCRACEANR